MDFQRAMNRRAAMQSLAWAGITFAVHPCIGAPQTSIIMGKRTDDIDSFDPHVSLGASSQEILGNIYETLITWDTKSGQLVPGLAEAWKCTDDNLTWSFRLAKGRKFASGNAVTADDVLFSLQRVFRLQSPPSNILAPLGLSASNIDQCVHVNDGEIQIKLPNDAASRLLVPCLTATVCSVIDKKTVQLHENVASAPPDDGKAWLRFNSAGSGPFWIANATRTDDLCLEVNCHHPRAMRVRPITIRNIFDSAEQLRQLQSREIHIARNVPLSVLRQKSASLSVKRKPKANLLLLSMNVAEPPLSDVNVRQALRFAVDARMLAETAGLPRWSTQQSFCPSALRSKSASFERILDPAKRLLNGKNFTLTLDHISGAPRSHVAELLVDQLAEVGFQIKLRPSGGREFLERLGQRKHELALVSWGADYLDPYSNVQTFCMNDELENKNSASPSRTMAWYNNWFDKDISRKARDAATENDANRREAIYDEIDRALRERGPFVFLLEETDFAVALNNGPEIEIGAVDNLTRYAAERLPVVSVKY